MAIDFSLDDDQMLLRDNVRRFMRERVAPIVAAHEQREEFAWDLLPELAPFGYIGGLLPEDRGGYGMRFTDWALLMEEAGYGARDVRVLRNLTLAPTYMSHQTHVVLARDLYPQRLPGDEPEALELVPWKLTDLGQLILREEFSEGRSIAALFLVREWLQQHAHG